VLSTDETGALSRAFNDAVSGLEERERLREAFGAFVDPEIADRVLREGSVLEGDELEVSVLFLDIRDFTAFAERASAREVVALLNDFYEHVVPVLLRHGGHANKFVGDGLLGVFGAPDRRPDHADRAVAAALEQFGRLDMLAANAGIAYWGDSVDAAVAEFDHTFRVNVRGMYLTMRAAARVMRERGGGRIVCTASTASYLGEELQASYNASKGAVMQLARSMALDLARDGVAVNAVAPGWVDTPANSAIVNDPAQWSKHRTHIPMDRPARPEEIAAVIAFLLSDDASYLCGSTVAADGGMTAGFRTTDWEAAEQPVAPRRPRAQEART